MERNDIQERIDAASAEIERLQKIKNPQDCPSYYDSVQNYYCNIEYKIRNQEVLIKRLLQERVENETGKSYTLLKWGEDSCEIDTIDEEKVGNELPHVDSLTLVDQCDADSDSGDTRDAGKKTKRTIFSRFKCLVNKKSSGLKTQVDPPNDDWDENASVLDPIDEGKVEDFPHVDSLTLGDQCDSDSDTGDTRDVGQNSRRSSIRSMYSSVSSLFPIDVTEDIRHQIDLITEKTEKITKMEERYERTRERFNKEKRKRNNHGKIAAYAKKMKKLKRSIIKEEEDLQTMENELMEFY